MIHPTAVVDPKAEIGGDVEIGPYSVIEKGVVIGPGSRIRSHAFIGEGTQIGKKCQIYQFASVGEAPQALAYRGEETCLLMGDQNIVREFVTLNRGTLPGGGKTVIGHNNLFMAYSHVAHDCHLGNSVILANGATLGGHIVIEDHAIVGGLSAIHQFCQIGAHAFISGLTGVSQDVPPYMLAAGSRAKLFGLNTVGLKRFNFSEKAIRALKKAYRIIFRSNLTLESALKQLREDEITRLPEIQHLLQFIQQSKRGITR
ncbi:MAG: acyl-[acyl-carrier-protein]--UDP-N-acetylglucosamine O-acyltransferase [Deltaproteobacteria bacterium RBG_16_48_10]|nr:MAG: acyl-[acyl-carrier-protein]--UDP-N-acetylglucosamine O-acyltransferase [Deltaproteobacteria bacterium RBG_16_48_10]